MAALCARGEHAERDIRSKLETLGLTLNNIDTIITQLKRENFLDETRYARAYCHDKLHFNGWGKLKIAYMLKAKGVSEACIEAATAEIDNEQDREILKKLLAAKWRKVSHKEARQARAAIVRFATGRGFEFSDIAPLLDELTSQA